MAQCVSVPDIVVTIRFLFLARKEHGRRMLNSARNLGYLICLIPLATINAPGL